MKKLIFSLALIASTVASADSFLYWMVDSGQQSYDYARIYAKEGDSTTYLNIYDGGFDYAYEDAGSGISSVSLETVNDARANGQGFYAALAGINPSDATFIIELYNDSNQFLSQTSMSGSELAAYVYSGGTSAPRAVGPWASSSYAIPEPSSGMLMLVGFAMLGLRRRRQKNA